jgi:hypothetical protein
MKEIIVILGKNIEIDRKAALRRLNLYLEWGISDMAKKWLQKANKEMTAKGTKGAFTAQAKKAGAVKKGGGIKTSFIDKELRSSNPTTRKRAQFAKNMKKIAKAR